MFGLFCFEEQCCFEYSCPGCLVDMCTSFSRLYICEWSGWVVGCAHVLCYCEKVCCIPRERYSGELFLLAMCGVFTNPSLFHILLLLDILRLDIFAHQMGVNGISLWFYYSFPWLLRNIFPYIMGIHLASSMKYLFVCFDYEFFVPSWVVCLFLLM